MPSFHVVLDQVDAAFDDERLVANAGLLLTATLADRRPSARLCRAPRHGTVTGSRGVGRWSRYAALSDVRVIVTVLIEVRQTLQGSINGVGLELGQQRAAVAGAHPGGLGQPGAGDRLASGD
jgi:hypothetical protein